MKWPDISAECTELGNQFSVTRAAYVMEFFGEFEDLYDYGELILERFLELVPPECKLYKTNKSMTASELKPAGLRRLKKQLSELRKKAQLVIIKDAAEVAVNDYSLEFHIGIDDEGYNNNIHIGLPVDLVEKIGAEKCIEVFKKFVSEIPFWGGVAGYGFHYAWGREYEMIANPVMMSAALRYYGLQLRNRWDEYQLEKRLKSVGWLTFVNDELVEKSGGAQLIQGSLHELVQVENLDRGMLFIAGEKPPLGDVNRQDSDIYPMATVNKALKKVRLPEWGNTAFYHKDSDTVDQWLLRMDK